MASASTVSSVSTEIPRSTASACRASIISAFIASPRSAGTRLRLAAPFEDGACPIDVAERDGPGRTLFGADGRDVAVDTLQHSLDPPRTLDLCGGLHLDPLT